MRGAADWCSERFDFVRKLHAFPDRVTALLQRDLPAALSVVYLDVNTDICNHNCPFCDGFYRSLRAEHLPWSRLETLVDEMEQLGVLAVVLAGDRGEPLLHPDVDKLLQRLARSRLQYALYTNGTIIRGDIWSWLEHAAFIRVSADAATAATHRLMHVYPEGRDDYASLISNVERLARLAPDVGVSFVLEPGNYTELADAADVFLGRGAHFVEYKPRYLPGYGLDVVWLRSVAETIRSQLAMARQHWGGRVVVNNQIESLMVSPGELIPLETPPRLCRTSLLRLVISTHGCYTCTPYRGESERLVGNILEQPLLGVVESSMRRALIDRPCSRVCAYHQQNEVLLALERAARSGGQDRTRGPEEVVPATVRPKDKFSRQDYFI